VQSTTTSLPKHLENILMLWVNVILVIGCTMVFISLAGLIKALDLYLKRKDKSKEHT
jgi:multisubunit Na+/H+ antiporter MnhG subunit